MARALGQIAPGTPQADPAVSALTELLLEVQERLGQVGLEAIVEALARFGPEATGAIPPLRELAKLRNAKVSEAARRALGEIEKSP